MKAFMPVSVFVLSLVISAQTATSGEYTAHEWGTFTSVQGSDGVLLSWRPLQTSQLPGFVYNWSKPGRNRIANFMLAGGKGGLTSLQRLETPVIYFYADEDTTVDASVRFPKGFITEWYPQASEIGPASFGISMSVAPDTTLTESGAAWKQIHIMAPGKDNAALGSRLPMDKSGSHYFAARETDANFIQIEPATQIGAAPETEKFIFYRGTGNFATPLTVHELAEGGFTLANTGNDPLTGLFVLQLKEGKGQFTAIKSISARAAETVRLETKNEDQSALARKLAAQMAAVLKSQGLFAREAEAMVNTWKDSWFAEDGVRVLYVLPRAWTDETLPLTLTPQPKELVRVMVGRAEILTSGTEQSLRNQLTRAEAGDTKARQSATAMLQNLGRFAEPAMRRVAAIMTNNPAASAAGWALLQQSARPATASAL